MDGSWGADFVKQYLDKYRAKHDRSTSRAEAVAAMSLAGCRPGSWVLDAPCGFGRHCVELAEQGYRVVGVDSSAAMLRAAAASGRTASSAAAASGRTASSAVAAGGAPSGPLWIHGDYRRLPCATGRFDVVVNLFTSIGFYGDDGDRAVLAEFHRVLRPGGRLVLDTRHRDALCGSLQPVRTRHLGDGRVLEEREQFDQVSGWLSTTHRYRAADGASRRFTSRLRLYTPTELVASLRRVGFGDVDCFGGLDGSPIGPDTRLVAVAHR